MAKPYRSKAIRNIKSAAGNTLSTTGNIASKGVTKTAKWLITDHTGASQLWKYSRRLISINNIYLPENLSDFTPVKINLSMRIHHSVFLK